MTLTYEHQDFYLGAYLIVNGCVLHSYYRENGLTTFIFENTEELRELVNGFYSNLCKTDALEFSKAIKKLKSIIHNSRVISTTTSSGELINGKSNKL